MTNWPTYCTTLPTGYCSWNIKVNRLKNKENKSMNWTQTGLPTNCSITLTLHRESRLKIYRSAIFGLIKKLLKKKVKSKPMLGKACTSIPLRLAKLQCRKAWLVHLLLLGRQVTLHLIASLVRYSFLPQGTHPVPSFFQDIFLFFPWRVKLFRYSFYFAICRDKSYCE